ncbi:hypothetical protein GMRT_12586 [Giardia muris]|uniref:Uncharacterized protein n=1 Tax=Giardia muris TaxID=5742 RepID=A0A4Z1SRC6_GIAMU|nr:hypothetical protein GMRT_12586 [Giardia muris]|eukprot:TNJ28454.1 hypothetical protein GMRT_12586 [Giardia muris]
MHRVRAGDFEEALYAVLQEDRAREEAALRGQVRGSYSSSFLPYKPYRVTPGYIVSRRMQEYLWESTQGTVVRGMLPGYVERIARSRSRPTSPPPPPMQTKDMTTSPLGSPGFPETMEAERIRMATEMLTLGLDPSTSPSPLWSRSPSPQRLTHVAGPELEDRKIEAFLRDATRGATFFRVTPTQALDSEVDNAALDMLEYAKARLVCHPHPPGTR